MAEVWCESHDDVTLLWDDGNQITVEFVQVKGADMDCRWSVAELTRQGKKDTKNTSLIGQSLGRAKCSEKTRFRIVTLTDVTRDLEILKHGIGTTGRDAAKIASLQRKLQKRCSTMKTSENGTTVETWVENCVWVRYESDESQTNSNMFRLERLINQRFGYLLSVPQIRSLYTQILEKVKIAAAADLGKIPDAFKIKRTSLVAWVKSAVDEVLFGLPGAAQSKMRQKMERCGISMDIVEKAVHLRLGYVGERLRSGYATVTPLTKLELTVLARMQLERAALEAGRIEESGTRFHERCLRALAEEQAKWSDRTTRPDAAFFQGYMYELTNRCQHAFDLAK